MRNILIKIAYDGTGFSGWQRQPNARTVCGELEAVLSVLTGEEVRLDGTSRTDAGVHALGQCASFQLPDGGIPTANLVRAANNMLAKDRLEGIGEIMLLSAEEMPEGFHARFSSRGKRYLYKIWNGPDKSPFRRTQYYQVQEPLDLEIMREVAALIRGTHDFKCFEAAGSTPRESTVRTVWQLDIDRRSDEVTISIAGDGFLYNMVRIIAGTLVETGLHRRTVSSVAEAMDELDRGMAGHTAPPQGLYLQEVFY